MIASIETSDPLTYEVQPGVTVGSLKTSAECQAAIWQLERERDNILGQIATDEARPAQDRRPGWRTKAASALRWKKRIITAVKQHMATLARPEQQVRADAKAALRSIRDKIILDTIREELGPREFERLIDLAKASRPDVFGGGG